MKHRTQSWPLTSLSNSRWGGPLLRLFGVDHPRQLSPASRKATRITYDLFLRYFVSVFSVLLALAVRLAWDPLLGDKYQHPYTFFFAAVALTSWYAGFYPSLLAIVLSYLLADWFFVAPTHSFDFQSWSLSDFVRLAGFLFSGLAIAFTSKALHSATERARARQRDLEKVQAQLKQHAEVLEERVQERTAELSEMIHSLETVCYQMAHNLRAPVRAMNGFTSILEEEYAPYLDAAGRDYMARISTAATQMDVLIEGLLEYGTLGHAHFPIEVLDLEGEIDRVLSDHRQEMLSNKATIRVQGSLPKVMGNSILLHSILTHFLDNALKFIAPGVSPEITIGADMDVNQARIWVKDNGIGIPPEYHHKVFQPFECVHTAGSYPGTGIGLAIAAKAAQRMNAKVGVESSSGKGSCFWLTLPVAPAK